LSTDVSEVLTASIIRDETSFDNYFTRQNIPEDNSEHHTRRRENLKSHFKRYFLHAVKSYDMGLAALLRIREEGVLRIFIALKNPIAFAGLELTTFVSSDKHINHYTTKVTATKHLLCSSEF
jgi:hypothetical protein